MVVFDTSVVAIAFDQNASIPLDPTTNKPLHRCRERIDALLAKLEQKRVRVMLPTPVISEYLVGGGPDKDKRLQEIVNSKAFVIVPFDLMAAVECALIEASENNKKLSPVETKAKVKFDRQIIAIAKSRGAKEIYTGDRGLAERAKASGLTAVLTWELPMPPMFQLKLTEESPVAATAVPAPAPQPQPQPQPQPAELTPLTLVASNGQQVPAEAVPAPPGGILAVVHPTPHGDAQAGEHQANAQGGGDAEPQG